MGGVIDLFGGAELGRGLAATAQMAARPNFELQFATLQNSLIDRINKKIDEVNKDKTDNVDAFLVLEKVRLTRTSDALTAYKAETLRAYAGVQDINAKLMDLDGLVDGAASDPEAFDLLLGQINQIADLTKPINGIPVGVMTDDGIAKMRRDGVVQVTRDGSPVKVTSYADFTDAAEARTAISEALTRTLSSISILAVKADAAAAQLSDINLRLTAVTVDIEAKKTATAAEKQQKVKDLEEQYALLLNTLSVMFEGQQSIADHLGRSLFNPPELEKGSVINMFT